VLGVEFLFWRMASDICQLHTVCELGTLHVESGNDPRAKHPQEIQAAGEGIRDAIKKSNRASTYANIQFQLLVGGAILYVVWHVLEMYLRTVRH
jgi:hypothetical protein